MQIINTILAIELLPVSIIFWLFIYQVIKQEDKKWQVILIKNDTQIQKIKENIATNDLKINDFVVVIGTPNEQGQIEAKFIRIMPIGMPVPPPFEQTK